MRKGMTILSNTNSAIYFLWLKVAEEWWNFKYNDGQNI